MQSTLGKGRGSRVSRWDPQRAVERTGGRGGGKDTPLVLGWAGLLPLASLPLFNDGWLSIIAWHDPSWLDQWQGGKVLGATRRRRKGESQNGTCTNQMEYGGFGGLEPHGLSGVPSSLPWPLNRLPFCPPPRSERGFPSRQPAPLACPPPTDPFCGFDLASLCKYIFLAVCDCCFGITFQKLKAVRLLCTNPCRCMFRACPSDGEI